MKTLSFYTAYTYIEAKYGLNMDQNEFITVGMIAYTKIGNKNTQIKGEILDVENGMIKLPCDIISIEGVFADFPDMVVTSNSEKYPHIVSSFIERYINYWKFNESLLYDDGRLLKYTQSGDTLYFDRDYKNVLLLYRAENLDSEGLPFINDKEADAIAAYCAYTILYRESIISKNRDTFQLAKDIQQEWGRLCDRARMPEKLSQNDVDKILDALTSCDRKMYGKSFKPVR